MQTDVTADTKIAPMLQWYAQVIGESYYTCEQCGSPYVTHQHYRNPNKCVECSGLFKSHDVEHRRELNRQGYRKRKHSQTL